MQGWERGIGTRSVRSPEPHKNQPHRRKEVEEKIIEDKDRDRVREQLLQQTYKNSILRVNVYILFEGSSPIRIKYN